MRFLIPAATGFMLIPAWNAFAQNPVIIFSGNSGEECMLLLADYNRISFTDEGMIAGGSRFSSEEVHLPYSSFSRFRLEDNGLAQTRAEALSPVVFSYSRSAMTLMVAADPSARFDIRVFTPEGMEVLSREVNGGETLSVSPLNPGLYIAVASGEEGKQTLSFIK